MSLMTSTNIGFCSVCPLQVPVGSVAILTWVQSAASWAQMFALLCQVCMLLLGAIQQVPLHFVVRKLHSSYCVPRHLLVLLLVKPSVSLVKTSSHCLLSASRSWKSSCVPCIMFSTAPASMMLAISYFVPRFHSQTNCHPVRMLYLSIAAVPTTRLQCGASVWWLLQKYLHHGTMAKVRATAHCL